MALAHELDEAAQRMEDINRRLAGAGLGEEDHEVDRMPGVHGDPYLRITLEAPDSRAVTRARIDDDDRWLRRVEAVLQARLPDRRDPEQRVVRRRL